MGSERGGTKSSKEVEKGPGKWNGKGVQKEEVRMGRRLWDQEMKCGRRKSEQEDAKRGGWGEKRVNKGKGKTSKTGKENDNWDTLDKAGAEGRKKEEKGPHVAQLTRRLDVGRSTKVSENFSDLMSCLTVGGGKKRIERCDQKKGRMLPGEKAEEPGRRMISETGRGVSERGM